MLASAVTISPLTRQPSWGWAIDYLTKNPDLWLVVPVPPTKTIEEQRHTVGIIRASIWRSVRRRGQHRLTSQYTPGRLWIRLV
jgi:hypothetical protein